MRAVAYPLNCIVFSLVRPGRLPWAGIAVRPRRTERWQGLSEPWVPSGCAGG